MVWFVRGCLYWCSVWRERSSECLARVLFQECVPTAADRGEQPFQILGAAMNVLMCDRVTGLNAAMRRWASMRNKQHAVRPSLRSKHASPASVI